MFRTLRGQYFIGSFIVFVAMLGLLLTTHDCATINDVVQENSRGQRLTVVELFDSRAVAVAGAGDTNRPGARPSAVPVKLAALDPVAATARKALAAPR